MSSDHFSFDAHIDGFQHFPSLESGAAEHKNWNQDVESDALSFEEKNGVDFHVLQDPLPGALETDNISATTAALVPKDWKRLSDALGDEGQDMPLLQWIELEKTRSPALSKASILRRLNVAFGIGKLLQVSNQAQINYSMDNFSVQESSHKQNTGADGGWEVTGVSMIWPPILVQLISVSFLRMDSSEASLYDTEDVESRDVTANVIGQCIPESNGLKEGSADESLLCQRFGEILHSLFSGERAFQLGCENGIRSENKEGDESKDLFEQQPPKKLNQHPSFSRALSIPGPDANLDTKPSHHQRRLSLEYRPLIEYGCPPSLSHLVRDLLSSGDCIYQSDNSFRHLEDAINDILRLLGDKRLLFESCQETHDGRHLLVFPQRLYGRSNEASMITDAFSRVASTGKSEVICKLQLDINSFQQINSYKPYLFFMCRFKWLRVIQGVWFVLALLCILLVC